MMLSSIDIGRLYVIEYYPDSRQMAAGLARTSTYKKFIYCETENHFGLYDSYKLLCLEDSKVYYMCYGKLWDKRGFEENLINGVYNHKNWNSDFCMGQVMGMVCLECELTQ